MCRALNFTLWARVYVFFWCCWLIPEQSWQWGRGWEYSPVFHPTRWGFPQSFSFVCNLFECGFCNLVASSAGQAIVTKDTEIAITRPGKEAFVHCGAKFGHDVKPQGTNELYFFVFKLSSSHSTFAPLTMRLHFRRGARQGTGTSPAMPLHGSPFWTAGLPKMSNLWAKVLLLALNFLIPENERVDKLMKSRPFCCWKMRLNLWHFFIVECLYSKPVFTLVGQLLLSSINQSIHKFPGQCITYLQSTQPERQRVFPLEFRWGDCLLTAHPPRFNPVCISTVEFFCRFL